MNIYIYGNQSFKKDIHQTLDHANIRFKIDSDSLIKEINSLKELKETIKKTPDDIFLIDDEKIIKKNSINQKIKFLTPKDGIEQDFLLDNNISEISIDSLSDLPKYILKKYEQHKSSLDDDIQQSIIGIVDEAYDEDIKLDEELSQLLSKEKIEVEDDEIEELQEDEDLSINLEDFIGQNQMDDTEEISQMDVNLDEIENLFGDTEENNSEITPEEFNSIMNFDEDVGLNNISHDYDDTDIITTTQEEKIDKNSVDNLMENLDDLDTINFENNMENMEELDNIEFNENIDDIDDILKEEDIIMDEYSELDSLNEKDILDALQGIEQIPVVAKNTNVKNEIKQSANVTVASSSVQDISELISKLLNNKTLEITIKIKD